MLGSSDSRSEVYLASRCISLLSGTGYLASGSSPGSRIAAIERAGNHGAGGSLASDGAAPYRARWSAHEPESRELPVVMCRGCRNGTSGTARDELGPK